MANILLDRNSGMVAEGTHLFKIKEVKEQAAKESGNSCLFITLVCQDQGEDLAKEQVLILTLTDKARFKVDEFLDALELPRKGSIDTNKFIGLSLRATIAHETYNGSLRANVKQCFAKGSTANPPVVHQEPPKGLPTDANASGSKNPFGPK